MTKSNQSQYVVIRTYSAGVHIGYLESKEGKEVTLTDARRVWYWDGANSLSQLATEGVKHPLNCKISVPVRRITLTEAIEIIECTDKAIENLNAVPLWKK